jgi:hypothetical protein
MWPFDRQERRRKREQEQRARGKSKPGSSETDPGNYVNSALLGLFGSSSHGEGCDNSSSSESGSSSDGGGGGGGD